MIWGYPYFWKHPHCEGAYLVFFVFFISKRPLSCWTPRGSRNNHRQLPPHMADFFFSDNKTQRMTTAVGPSSFEVSWPQSPRSWAWVRKLACHMRVSFCRSKILDLPLVFKKKWKISDLSWHNTNVIKWFINLGTSEKWSSHRNDHRIRISCTFFREESQWNFCWDHPLKYDPSTLNENIDAQQTLQRFSANYPSTNNSPYLRIAFLFHEV